MTASQRVAQLFGHPSAALEYGEDVSIGHHMLQAAAAAEAVGASDAVVVAALLHDVGHFVNAPTNDHLGNRYHARDGAVLVEDLFPPEVTDPIRLHVAAKRYLVAADPSYFELLSPASVQTLEQQGGPLDDDGIARFEAEPHAEAALAVRRFDEAAKVAGADVASLEHYGPLIERLARA